MTVSDLSYIHMEKKRIIYRQYRAEKNGEREIQRVGNRHRETLLQLRKTYQPADEVIEPHTLFLNI